ncbi:GMC oxidoreductase [Xylanimonas cellulosilytica DSM 15894]|uniref:GMC oxidoreductase n=1 Tax=Xylanimonas cellulosilytica (strain DSM 15894 / JCM 12276 / CECT 5975 / KCTC 9989 / LMG 20990 / NBRC 107835 / XIL07) TaxID=446471 RepID=D1BXR5_XYLCX|nr:FAD-dependent oxidoreductase [Xylanimonas cellulosilytica]ACZ31706.1 GMC oxidoreductase [Xylanimonas cellulosilytica DSM 15894]
MTILSPSDPLATDYDCCVVGAGPVGLAFATEAARAGRKVLLVDAGTETSGKHDVITAKDGSTEIVDPARHAPLDLTTRQGLGGTSWLWGGRCVAYEPIDFEDRDYVPDSRWPITIDDVRPWYAAAAEHLDCGAAVFASNRPDWDGLREFRMSNLERWARQPQLAPGLGARVTAHPSIDVLLGTRVVDIDLAEDGSVTGLAVLRDGAPATVSARTYVLAMGGLEITRFLLDVQVRRPELFGGVDGPLGRYYMGHATGSIAEIVLDDPKRAADLDFVLDEHDTYVRRRFTLTEEAQREHRVLNTSFYLDNPPFYEHEHKNATLSLVFLGLRIPAVGRRMIAEGIRLRHIGEPPYRIGAHLWNIARKPWRAAVDVLDILRRRYWSAVRKPGFILRNDGGRYALHYHGEQIPHPDSRVHLVPGADGKPVLRIDYRYAEQDIDSLLLAHELLDKELRAAGLGHLEYLAPDEPSLRALTWQQSTDGFHSIGTTRMSDDPDDGVVDQDCRVHGTTNLYLASSSVFRTSAEANPTYFAAVLAVRLAHHLAELTGTPEDRATSAASVGSTP